jgi:hypothetical protein
MFVHKALSKPATQVVPSRTCMHLWTLASRPLSGPPMPSFACSLDAHIQDPSQLYMSGGSLVEPSLKPRFHHQVFNTLNVLLIGCCSETLQTTQVLVNLLRRTERGCLQITCWPRFVGPARMSHPSHKPISGLISS